MAEDHGKLQQQREQELEEKGAVGGLGAASGDTQAVPRRSSRLRSAAKGFSRRVLNATVHLDEARWMSAEVEGEDGLLAGDAPDPADGAEKAEAALAPAAGVAKHPAPAPAKTFGTVHGVVVSQDTMNKAKNPSTARHVLLYHVCVLFVIVVNLPLVIVTARNYNIIVHGDNGSTGLLVIAFGILMRSELFLNALYWLVCKAGRHSPPGMRYWMAQFLYHAPGGLHAGCGITSFIWLVVYTFQWWLLPYGRGGAGPGLTTTPYALVCSITAIMLTLMIAAMCILALAFIRRRYHNVFELSHRYIGWSSIAVLWVHVTVKAAYWANYDAQGQLLPPDQRQTWGYEMLGGTNTWATVAITILTFHPWLSVTRRTAQASVHGQPGRPACMVLADFAGHAPAGTWGRLSVFGLGQWHPFAVVSGPRRSKKGKTHSMIIAPAGDWTKQQIGEATQASAAAGGGAAPRTYWVRLLRAPGFMYTTRMWSRIVCVASGAGIAPVLPCVLQRTADIYVVWITSRPETFGPVQQMLQDALPPEKLWIHDTATQGRPDAVELTLKAVRKEQAEAMYIVANLPLTFAVVKGCREVGVKSFGAIWDS